MRKEIFATNCGTCHTLAAAGTDGVVGPNLDQLLVPSGTNSAQLVRGQHGARDAGGHLRHRRADAEGHPRGARRPSRSPPFVAAYAGQIGKGPVVDTATSRQRRARRADPRPRRSTPLKRHAASPDGRATGLRALAHASYLLASHSDFLVTEARRLRRSKDSGKDDRNRPRDHELGDGRARGRRAGDHRERRGRAHDPVGGRVHRLRRAPRRHRGQAPGGDEPREHGVLDQALHGPQGGRGQGGGDDRPVQGRRRPQRRRPRRRPRQAVLAAGDLGDDPAEAEDRRRGEARRARSTRR